MRAVVLLQLERWIRSTFHLKPPYYRMRERLVHAVRSGNLQSSWEFEEHWSEVEKILGGSGRHWLDHTDLDWEADRIGVDYDHVRTVGDLIELLRRIGDRYAPGFYKR